MSGTLSGLSIRWIADFRSSTLSIQYCPLFDGLDARILETLHTPFMTSFPDEVKGDLEMLRRRLLTECLEPPQPLNGVGWDAEAHVAERDIGGRYMQGGRAPQLTFNYQHTHPFGGYKNERIDFDELAPEIARLVARLDDYAATAAQTHWSRRHNEVVNDARLEGHVPQPLRVFISYRGQRSDVAGLAQAIFNDLAEPGGTSFFSVFLDKPRLRAGEWKPQLLSQIEAADVFMPLLSDDYEEGDTAKWEFETAVALRADRGRPEVIPVLVEGSWGDHPAARFNGRELLLPIESDAQLLRRQLGSLRSLLIDVQFDS